MEVQDLERRIKEQEYGRGFDFSAAFPALMRKVYLWMTFALAISVTQKQTPLTFLVV